MSQQTQKDYKELCSERTIFSDDQGFFGELFTIVKNCCTEKWLKNIFESEISDATKLKLLFDEADVSDVLLGTLEHVKSVYRQKDSAFSYRRRKEGESLHEKGELDRALVLLTQAVLRAPAKGTVHTLYFTLLRIFAIKISNYVSSITYLNAFALFDETIHCSMHCIVIDISALKSNFTFAGVDKQIDEGMSLGLALWSRSAVLLDLNRGDDALVDIQSAVDNGLDDAKKQLDYYVRLAKANASKY